MINTILKKTLILTITLSATLGLAGCKLGSLTFDGNVDFDGQVDVGLGDNGILGALTNN